MPRVPEARRSLSPPSAREMPQSSSLGSRSLPEREARRFGRLQVAVDDAGVVQSAQTRHQRHHQIDERALIQRSARTQHRVQILPLQPLRHEVGHAVLHANVENRNDARMADGGGAPRFTKKAVAPHCAARRFVGEDLQRQLDGDRLCSAR